MLIVFDSVLVIVRSNAKLTQFTQLRFCSERLLCRLECLLAVFFWVNLCCWNTCLGFCHKLFTWLIVFASVSFDGCERSSHLVLGDWITLKTRTEKNRICVTLWRTHIQWQSVSEERKRDGEIILRHRQNRKQKLIGLQIERSNKICTVFDDD